MEFSRQYLTRLAQESNFIKDNLIGFSTVKVFKAEQNKKDIARDILRYCHFALVFFAVVFLVFLVSFTTSLGFSSLMHHAGRNGEAFGLAGIGLVFLKDTIDVYRSLFKIAKRYDEICTRAAKIFKHK